MLPSRFFLVLYVFRFGFVWAIIHLGHDEVLQTLELFPLDLGNRWCSKEFSEKTGNSCTVWSTRIQGVMLDFDEISPQSHLIRSEPNLWSLCIEAFSQPEPCTSSSFCFPLLNLAISSEIPDVPVCARNFISSTGLGRITLRAWLQRDLNASWLDQQQQHICTSDLNEAEPNKQPCKVSITSVIKSLATVRDDASLISRLSGDEITSPPLPPPMSRRNTGPTTSPQFHVTCRLHGGLGNQLHQIFTTIAYTLRYGLTFDIDEGHYRSFDEGTPRPTYWTTLLDGVHALMEPPPRRNPAPVQLRERRFVPLPPPPFGLTNHAEIARYEIFPSPIYFEDQEAAVYDLLGLSRKRQEVCDRFSSTGLFSSDYITVSAHFRLGDFRILNGLWVIQPIEFYEASLNHIIGALSEDNKIHVLVFTDGDLFLPISAADGSSSQVYTIEPKARFDAVEVYIQELRQRFPNISFELVLNSHFADWEQLLLMSCCDHHIVPSSTFSWWGAYLHRIVIRRENPNGKVIVTYPASMYSPNNPLGMAVAGNISMMFPSDWTRI